MIHTLRMFAITLQLLIWPLICIGCGAYDMRLCKKCIEKLDDGQQYTSVEGKLVDNGAPLWSVGSYQDVWRKVILAWKDHGRRDFDPLVGLSVVKLICALQLEGYRNVTIVPLPSSKRSIKQRGFWQTMVLAKYCVRVLNERGYNAKLKPLLKQRNAKKQVNFSADERALNKAGSIFLSKRHRKGVNKNVILIDDICTTGASMQICTKILNDSGYNVIYRICLANA